MVTASISIPFKDKKIVILLLSMLFLVGCGGIQKMALGTFIGPMVTDAAQEIEREGNWETFRGAILEISSL